ncbi:MAG TPA: MFS transporter [Gaiellaceae bacterium]|jgi:MFS family permease|nr:MFS transporter [Gaiellaceae bacterium]
MPDRIRALLRRRDFGRTYLAISISELGDAFQYIALMWFALEAGGPLGVIAVRLADSVPALLFGLHGGLAADRWDRRRTMIAADLVRAAVLIPVAVMGLRGDLPLGVLVAAAFVLTAAASYFAPAYGALLPALVERGNVQAANGLVRATADALSVTGWALAALLLAFVPLSAFFLLNAISFVASAALLAGVTARRAVVHEEPPHIAEGFAALRPLPMLAAAVGVLAVTVTISSGTWIVGVPELVRSDLGRGAAAFSVVAAGYALGSIIAGIVLVRIDVRRKALGSILAWIAYLPGYALFAVADSVGIALAAAVVVGLGQGAAWVLVNSAAQEQIPDRLLGRVVGLIALVHRGAHATGLLLVAPLFAVAEPQVVFAAAALAIPATAVAGVLIAGRRAAAAPAAA